MKIIIQICEGEFKIAMDISDIKMIYPTTSTPYDKTYYGLGFQLKDHSKTYPDIFFIVSDNKKKFDTLYKKMKKAIDVNKDDFIIKI